MRRELKPSMGFIDFMDQVVYSELIRTEKLRLESYNFTKKDINDKFKKSYKNRYFLEQKKKVICKKKMNNICYYIYNEHNEGG